MSVDFNPAQNKLNAINLNKNNSVGFGQSTDAKVTSDQPDKDTYEKKGLSTGAKIGIGAAVVAAMLGVISAVKCHKEGNWKKFGEYLLPWKWGKKVEKEEELTEIINDPVPTKLNINKETDISKKLADLEEEFDNYSRTDLHGHNHIHYAVGSITNCELLEAVIKKYPEELNAFNKDGLTPLAVTFRQHTINGIEQAEVLIRNGAKPYIKNKDGKMPLDWADDEERAAIQPILDELGLKPPKES